jgi:hypothetical protein
VPRPAVRLQLAIAGLVLAATGCAAAPTVPPSFVPGSAASPREFNLIASDYSFVPSVVAVFPGETVLIHVVNGGLDPHEAVIGDASIQAAWEAAEAVTANRPPGPTALVSVPPDVAGIRVFVGSGQRVDVRWDVPVDAAQSSAGSGGGRREWYVGCHIPGHFEKGMVVPVAFLAPPGPAASRG